MVVPGYRDNLPAAVTSFIGRERDVEDVKSRLAAGRLVTLTGVGGSGKTRLALQVARTVLGRYADGVWLVSSVRGAAEVRSLDGVARKPAADTAALLDLLGYGR